MSKINRKLLIIPVILLSISIVMTGCGKSVEETTTTATTTTITSAAITTSAATTTTTTTIAAIDMHLNPAVGATSVSTIPTLSWDVVPDTVAYEITISEERGGTDKFATIDFQTSTPMTSYTLKFELKPNTTYWWRVQSMGRAGKRLSWSVGSFTTK